MSWVAVAVAGAAIVGGVTSNQASKRAAGAAGAASDASIAEQARQYDTTRADFAPYRAAGTAALDKLARLYGLGTPSAAAQAEQRNASKLVGDTMLPGDVRLESADGGQNKYYHVYLGDQRIGALAPGGKQGRFVNDTNLDLEKVIRDHEQQQQPQTDSSTSPDMSVFFQSPDYQFNLAEGQKAIDRSLAARGRSLSGAGVRQGVRYASGMASQQFGDFYNRLASIAGIGQAATGSTAAAGANAANNNSTALMSAGNARASAYLQNGQTIGNTVNGLASNYILSQYMGNQRAPNSAFQMGPGEN